MPFAIPSTPGTYIVVLYLRKGEHITVGHLGNIFFDRGWYAYVGSAFGPGGLAARLGRHLSAQKRLRWHIDYLRAWAEPRQMWISTQPDALEHKWAAVLSGLAHKPIANFGCSDCKCPTHLFYFRRNPKSLPGRFDAHCILCKSIG